MGRSAQRAWAGKGATKSNLAVCANAGRNFGSEKRTLTRPDHGEQLRWAGRKESVSCPIISFPPAVSAAVASALLALTLGVAPGCGGGNSPAGKPSVNLSSAATRDTSPDPKFVTGDNPVPGEYIVSLTDEALASGGGGTTASSAASAPSDSPDGTTSATIDDSPESQVASSLCGQYGGQVGKSYNGFGCFLTSSMTDSQARAMSHDPRVEFVEQNCEVEYQVSSEDDAAQSGTTTRAVQSSAPYGLDRIDQRDLPLNAEFNYNATGQGVHVYVLDSGVRADHVEFEGRATNDWSHYAENYDNNGHGTMVASIIGGKTVGVAKKARLHSVKVFSAANKVYVGVRWVWFSVSLKSSVIDGMNWVKDHHQKPAVANLSITNNFSGFDGWFVKHTYFPAVAKAMKGLIAKGIIFVCSAGNDSDTAANTTPADRTEAIVVGSVDSNDNIAEDSNYGDRLDVFAPGVGVYKATNAAPDRYDVLADGTSFAAPHVTGVVALYLQTHPNARQEEVETWLKANASVGKVHFETSNKGAGIAATTPNRLLFTNQ